MSLIKCRRCGEMFSDSYKTCPFCEEDDAYYGGRVKKRRSRRTETSRRKAPSILGPVVVLVLILLVLLVVWLLFGDRIKTALGGEKTPVTDVTTVPDTPDTPDPAKPESTVSLNRAVLALDVGEKETLKVNEETDETCAWSSSDPTVATVSDSGEVTALAAGNAVITAHVGDAEATCAVTVKAAGDSDGNTGNTGNNTGGVRINQAANPNNVPTVNTTDTATHVYATKNGKYFHTDKTCSGMTNAKRGTFTAAVKAGKKPCPTCITPAKLTVYATYGGKYYHVNATCSGMTNAFAVKASTAISYNKTACPTCAKVLNKVGKNNQAGNGGANGAGGNNTAANNNKATASTNVYIKLGAGTNNYYHVAAKCAATGMTGGQNVTLEYALSHNYTACPSCKPPSKIQS